jgi:hypothetical protein
MRRRTTAAQEYYVVTAKYEKPEFVDFDLVTSKTENFYNSRQYLHYVSSDTLNGLPILKFIYITEQDDDLESFFEEM